MNLVTWLMIGLLLVVIAATVTVLLNRKNEKALENFKEWLKWAVAQAEKELGSGTGQLKLRMVYDMATDKFPWLEWISFEKFSTWVDEALEWLEEQLSTNKAIAEVIIKEE